MNRDEIIAKARKQMERVPTLPGYKTHTVAVKNENFDPVPSFSSDENSFSFFYFLRFRQVTVRSTNGVLIKEFQDWEFVDFVAGRALDDRAPQLH